MAENNGNGKERFKRRYTTLFKNSQEIILAEGAGGGYASHPWVMDDYERELGLEPEEAWLIHRLLKYKWDDKALSFPSFADITQKSVIGRTRLDNIRDSLLRKGYISIAARGVQRGNGTPDRKIRYDVTGVLTALFVAIVTDPFSEYANRANEPEPPPGATNICEILETTETTPRPEYGEVGDPAEVNKWYNERGLYLDWGTMKVKPLADIEEKPCGKVREITCSICHKPFHSKAHNALYCPGCKSERKNKPIFS